MVVLICADVTPPPTAAVVLELKITLPTKETPPAELVSNAVSFTPNVDRYDRLVEFVNTYRGSGAALLVAGFFANVDSLAEAIDAIC